MMECGLAPTRSCWIRKTIYSRPAFSRNELLDVLCGDVERIIAGIREDVQSDH